MDASSLKKAVEAIEMPDAMRHRITMNSKRILMSNEEDSSMNKARKWFIQPVALAAVLALCICLPIVGMAAGNSGFFRDIMRGTAVIGMEYEQATDEITADAVFVNGELIVTANFLIPDASPYRECEELAVGHYRIMTGDGVIVAEGEESKSAALVNGQAVMGIPVEALSAGDYFVRIDAFIGSEKAEQPLPMRGFWECVLTVE